MLKDQQRKVIVKVQRICLLNVAQVRLMEDGKFP